MDYAEFLRLVESLDIVRQLGPDHRVVEAVARFAYDFSRRRPPFEERGSIGLESLGHLIEGLLAFSSEEEADSGEPKPAVRLASEFLIKQIDPWVEGIRQELFGSKDVPFATPEEGAAWFRELDDSDDRKTSTVRQIIDVSDSTGFTQGALLKYIVAGIRPVLSEPDIFVMRERHRLPSGTSLARPFITVEIYREPTFNDLLSIYQTLKQRLETKSSRTYSAKHLELYQMVQRRGGEPQRKGTVAFWESIQKEWNEKHPDEQYTTWKGPKVTYDRLCEKLREQYRIEEAREDETEIFEAAS